MLYLIVFVLVAVIGVYAWSKLSEELARLDAQEKASAKIPGKDLKNGREGVQTLKKDPKTGVYRIDDE